MKFTVQPPSVIVDAFIMMGISILLPIVSCFAFKNGFFGDGLAILTLWISGVVVLLIACFSKKLIIGEWGVKHVTLFKSHEMCWEEIKIVGIGYFPIKAPGRKPWIYFSADEVSLPILHAKMINEKFFVIASRKKVIEAVQKYWHNPIDGLDGMSEFEKLHKPKRRLT